MSHDRATAFAFRRWPSILLLTTAATWSAGCATEQPSTAPYIAEPTSLNVVNAATPGSAAVGLSGAPVLVVSRSAPAKCLTVAGTVPAPGAQLVITSCAPADTRQWFVRTPASELRTTGGLCVTAPSGDGQTATLGACNGATVQHWAYTVAGQFQTASARCLDIWQAQASDGTRVIRWPYNGNTNQQWDLDSARVAGVTQTASVRLNATTEILSLGDTVQLTAAALNAAGGVIAGRTVMWSTGNAQVATVSSTGVVTAIAAGATAVTATVDGRTATAAVTVGSRRQVTVVPGQSIQAAVDANAAGTLFLIKAGVHHGQSVVPKDSDAFVGETGTVLTGDDVTPYAFRWADGRFPRGVRIARLVVEHYAPGKQMGAILAGGADAAHATRGWTVDSCEVRYNAGGGVRLGDRMQVLHSNIHHNAQIGLVGLGDSVRVEGNEIAYNNYGAAYDFLWEAGGVKFVLTNWLAVRNNYVHHNTGPGLWADIDNRSTLVEGNRVEDNAGVGIIEEISRSAVIRDNVVQRNGAGYHVWLHGSGILVQNSSDVEIYGNTVAANYNGITAIQQNRGSGIYGPWVTRNVYVHDNDVTMTQGLTGFAQDVGDNTLFSAATMRFEHNRYVITGLATPFAWANTWVSVTQWNGYGQDATGTFR